MKRSVCLSLAAGAAAVAVVAGAPLLGGADACAYPIVTTWGQIKQLYGCSSPGWPFIFAAMLALLRG
jgi:hypothetical protein